MVRYGECDLVLRGWSGNGEKSCGNETGMGTKRAGMGKTTCCGAGMETRLFPQVTL